MERLGLTVALIGLATTAALAPACGDGGGKPPRDVTADDLPQMVLRLGDLPEGSQQVDVWGDASADSPAPTPNDAIFVCFQLPAVSEATPPGWVLSAALLLHSTEEATRSLEGIVRNFKIVHEPLVDRSNCAVNELYISALGDERRAYWLSTYDCPSARDKAIIYARTQEQRIETVLQEEP